MLCLRVRVCRVRAGRWRFTSLLFVLALGLITLSKLIMLDSVLTFMPDLVSIDPRNFPLRVCAGSVAERHSVSCPALMQGDTDALRNVTNKAWLRFFENVTSPCSLRNLADNCAVLSSFHGYNSWPVTPEEKAFPIAFGIRMHKDPQQAEQLLRTIYRPHNFYCIHVDAASSDEYVYEPLRKVGACFPNVKVLSDRVHSVYSSIRLVQAEMACMNASIASGIPWRYYLPLTGQEFPLKTNAELVTILRILNGTNDVESYTVDKIIKPRYERRYVIKKRRIAITNEKNPPPPANITMRKGSAYGSFSREFVAWLLRDPVARQFQDWLHTVYSPEEFIWATLNAMPGAPGGYPVITRHSDRTHLSRAVIWVGDKDKCRGFFQRAVCVFSSADLPWLVVQPQTFANKFDCHRDQVVLDCMEDTLRARARARNPFYLQWDYYRNLPYVRQLT